MECVRGDNEDEVRYGPIWILGFGQLAIIPLGATYDFCVPIFLQAGRPGYDAGAEVRSFGLNRAITGIVMTLDNMATLFLLLCVGALSDRARSRWGRRKPFIMVGAPIAVTAFVLIGCRWCWPSSSCSASATVASRR